MDNIGQTLTASKRAVHLVLGAGGVKTFSYIGALQELQQAGIEIKSVSCCSAGTLIGALLCGGCDLKKLESYIVQNDLKIFRGRPILYTKWLSLLGYLRYPYATHHPIGFPKFIELILGNDLPLKLLTIPFATVGVDIGQSSFYIISARNNPDMPLSEAVRIAITIPFLWAPYQPIGTGRIIVDAAIATRSPSWLPDKLMNLESDNHPILVLRPVQEPNVQVKKGLTTFVESLFHAVATSWDEFQETANPRLRIVEINCAGFDVADFGLKPEQKQFLIDEGRVTMRRFISDGSFLKF